MRFKNFSTDPIEFDAGTQLWHHPVHAGVLQLRFTGLVQPGEVTQEFDQDDPLVQRMLTLHPELRPFVTPTVWQWLRKPAL